LKKFRRVVHTHSWPFLVCYPLS